MARLEFFVVAESVSVDQFTNQVSVFSILEEIRAEHFPIAISHCVGMSLWRSETGDFDQDFQAVLRVTSPGLPPRDVSTNFRFAPSGLRMRVIQRVVGVRVEQEGDLVFELLLNGHHIAEHVITVQRAEPVDVIASSAVSE